jgi:hypothetical protein
MFPRILLFTALIALVVTSATRGEPIAPNRSEPDYRPKDLGYLHFYRTVTLRGVLTFEHHRKLEPPPEVRYSAYVLRTPGVYTATYEVNPRETYFHTGLGEFYVEAPHYLSLIPYRGQAVEISGRLLPKGKVPYPTLVVEKIVQLRAPTI